MVQPLIRYARERITPTDDQAAALECIAGFLESDKRCFMLKGYAGTGKTFLTQVIVGYLEECRRKVALMAPTGRAARILSEKSGTGASTIHKGIYNLDFLDEIVLREQGKVKYKFKYNIERNNLGSSGVVIVDEASMISDRYNESDFFMFGSGRLLSDLVDYADLKYPDSDVKLILIGDPAQLPPVGDPISGALTESYFSSRFGLPVLSYELTKVVRQREDSHILKFATKLREILGSRVRNTFRIDYGTDIKKLDVRDITDLYLDLNPELSAKNAVIIHYENKSALEYNLLVRDKKFDDKYSLCENDTLMIVQNNYNYPVELLNGTLIKVRYVAGDPEIKSGMLSYNPNGDECRVSCRFRRVMLSVPSIKGDDVDLECLILEDFLYSPKPAPDYAQNVALYLDFKIRNPHLKPKTKEFSDALRKDIYFNAVKVKYGYSLTCHKAQGGEWEHVLLNLDVGMGVFSDAYIRWIYTAVTRASKTLYVFNAPVLHQFSKLNYMHQLIPEADNPEQSQNLILISDTSAYKALVQKLGVNGLPHFRESRFFEIWAVTSQKGIEVTEHRKENFCDIYRFEMDGRKAGFKFWFNGKNQFTRIESFVLWTVHKEFSAELAALFATQVTIKLVHDDLPPDSKREEAKNLTDEEEPETQFFDESMLHLKPLFQALKELLEEYHIATEKIEHLQYLENYHFSRGDERAVIQFWYDKNYRFSTAAPLLKSCNSNKLLNDLHSIINQIKKSFDE